MLYDPAMPATEEKDTFVADYARLRASLPAKYTALRDELVAEMLAGHSCEFLNEWMCIKPSSSQQEWNIIYKKDTRTYSLSARVAGCPGRAIILRPVSADTANILNNSLLREGRAANTDLILMTSCGRVAGFEVRPVSARSAGEKLQTGISNVVVALN
jgi:hypothetical protein